MARLVSFQTCAKNPWVPLDGTPIYGVRPEETRSVAASQPQQYADSPVEPSIYAPTVKGVQEVSQQSTATLDDQSPAWPAPSAEPTFVPEPVQDIRVADFAPAVPAQPEVTQQQQDPGLSYFIPAPETGAPSAGSEDSLLLSQPESTGAPFIAGPGAAQEEPYLVTAPPSESFSYSTFNADAPAAPVQVPLGVQEQIQQQQASILSNFDDVPTRQQQAEEAPQQVAVFFSAPAQQAVNTPTLEYLPPHSS